VEHCRAAGDCRAPLVATPTGTGEHVTASSEPVGWTNPSCSGGAITNTITSRVAGSPEAPTATGTWVASADPVVFPGPALCGIYLGTFSLGSA
jgi:hypothetical protein